MSIIDLFHSAKGFKTPVLIAMLLFLLSAGKSLRSQPAVEILQAVKIGGMDQWILACGDQPDLPVLLWLHGGSGAAEMPWRDPLINPGKGIHRGALGSAWCRKIQSQRF